eukprot:TRINITY_DN30306_c0_g3_i1.p1 TRINITY_DN30306_c0_g3~~TRINITY_DN30306_c0_g3_i1.p1  ORF type:complete len:503 (-),score=137.22 TRINITY_DN30306_c0_g3_i1:221-1729(-)
MALVMCLALVSSLPNGRRSSLRCSMRRALAVLGLQTTAEVRNDLLAALASSADEVFEVIAVLSAALAKHGGKRFSLPAGLRRSSVASEASRLSCISVPGATCANLPTPPGSDDEEDEDNAAAADAREPPLGALLTSELFAPLLCTLDPNGAKRAMAAAESRRSGGGGQRRGSIMSMKDEKQPALDRELLSAILGLICQARILVTVLDKLRIEAEGIGFSQSAAACEHNLVCTVSSVVLQLHDDTQAAMSKEDTVHVMAEALVSIERIHLGHAQLCGQDISVAELSHLYVGLLGGGRVVQDQLFRLGSSAKKDEHRGIVKETKTRLAEWCQDMPAAMRHWPQPPRELAPGEPSRKLKDTQLQALAKTALEVGMAGLDAEDAKVPSKRRLVASLPSPELFRYAAKGASRRQPLKKAAPEEGTMLHLMPGNERRLVEWASRVKTTLGPGQRQVRPAESSSSASAPAEITGRTGKPRYSFMGRTVRRVVVGTSPRAKFPALGNGDV